MNLREIPIKNRGKERNTVSIRVDRNPANLVGKGPDKRYPSCTENYPDIIVHLNVDKNRIDMSQYPWLADVMVSCSYRECKYFKKPVDDATNHQSLPDTVMLQPREHR